MWCVQPAVSPGSGGCWWLKRETEETLSFCTRVCSQPLLVSGCPALWMQSSSQWWMPVGNPDSITWDVSQLRTSSIQYRFSTGVSASPAYQEGFGWPHTLVDTGGLETAAFCLFIFNFVVRFLQLCFFLILRTRYSSWNPLRPTIGFSWPHTSVLEARKGVRTNWGDHAGKAVQS